MSIDFVFFTTDDNDWNYNKLINNNVDPFDENKKIDENNNYNVKKYNTIIFLKELLKHCNFNNDLIEWVNKKCFNGGKSDYFDILCITTYIFYYDLFKTNNDIINYKDFRKWCLKNPLYITTDRTLDDFEGCGQTLREYINNETFNKIFKKVMDIEDDETKKRYIIICLFLKQKIYWGSGLGKLC
jgi:hypothetical protein